LKLSERVRIFGKVVLCGLICSSSSRLTVQTIDVQGDTGNSKAHLIVISAFDKAAAAAEAF
jgi:hypothetical protein